MQRFRVQEWFWLGVIAVALAIIALVILEPWLPLPRLDPTGKSLALFRVKP
ncbi:hypothetical protein [Brevundimonas sp.]|uniref:hypothetical protein n=1 Tax=Brevundimonas sp. TaxID=1871086 RepID=UPI00286C1C97|nr:hypothetical protein [Brevundimonas sp.]